MAAVALRHGLISDDAEKKTIKNISDYEILAPMTLAALWQKRSTGMERQVVTQLSFLPTKSFSLNSIKDTFP